MSGGTFLEVNVLGVYLCCRPAIPGMIARGGGRIVNVASGAAYLPGSRSTAYSASKAAVHRFSETLANQLEPHGIPVFSISPGLVRTELIGEPASATTRPGLRPSWRRGSSARSPQAGSTRSRAATSMPSTTTSTTSEPRATRS